jgi:hypothetical protein
VLAPPLSLALAIFPEDYSEAHASTTVAVLALLPQSKHPLPQLVSNNGSRRGTTPFGDHFNATGANANVLRVSLSAQCHW